jgi:hypothetical protein
MFEVVLDLLDEQPLGVVLAGAGGLLHADLKIAELALDLLARQHMQAARQDCCGEYCYWNGQYRVDARYNRPYLGPRP